MNNTSFPITRASQPRTNPRHNNETNNEDMEQSFLFQANQTSTTNSVSSPANTSIRKRSRSSSSDDSVNAEEPQKKKIKKTIESEYGNSSENAFNLATKSAEISTFVESENGPNELLSELKYIINKKTLSCDVFLAKFNKLSTDSQKELMEYYNVASQENNTIAIIHLGYVYAVVEEFKDIPKAMALFKQAADTDDSTAMNNLGILYSNEPSLQDIGKAIAWYEKAAVAGNSDAMQNLGILYHMEPSAKDIGKAVEWYEKAAEAGKSAAMNNLEFWHSLHELTALQDKTIRRQFGMIIKALNTFIEFEAVIKFINGEALDVCLGNKRFLLPILQSKCTEVLDKPSFIWGLYDKSTYLKKGIQQCVSSISIDSENLPLLLHYCDCRIDFSNVTLNCADLNRVDLSEFDLSGVQLEGVYLANVRLNIEQMQQGNLQDIALIDCIISYQSVYNKLYQTYKLLFAENQEDSSFNIIPVELKRIQLAMMLKTIIQEVEDRGGKIERIGEIERWVKNISWGYV
ncbi:MAG: pentapeptide repeat-containing protein [Neisseriaceae bacterium]